VSGFVYEALPARVVFGWGTSSQAAAEVAALGCSRALVLSTPGQRGGAEHVAAGLGPGCAGVFSEAAMHTPVAVTERAMAVAHRLSADCTVAIGGGSAIGLGKAMALRADLPQVVMPTTYAGSEMTPVLGETADGDKTTRRTLKVLPETVLYDVELTLSLPAAVSAASGVNAMAHACEALYADNANPVSEMMAAQSVRLLAGALPAIMRDPRDKQARADALRGAWLAGMCLATAGMALHHHVCHILGGAFGLPHAPTHAIMLPHVIAYNAAAAPEAMAVLAHALDASDAADGIGRLVTRLGLARSLAALGMPEAGIEHAARLAVRRPCRNPAELDYGRIRSMLAAAWAGDPPVRSAARAQRLDQRAGADRYPHLGLSGTRRRLALRSGACVLGCRSAGSFAQGSHQA
jgi:maleylacetate reductase